MVAYVKNRSNAGRWYWVLSVVIPTQDGYVSTRIKPSGALFAAAKTLYAEVLDFERNQSLEQAVELLLGRLVEMGFPTYADFAAQALEQELAGLERACGRTASPVARLLLELGERLEDTGRKQSELLEAFQALQSIPTNMRIIASRLEPSGGPVSAISDNYKFSSAEISRKLETLAGAEDNICLLMAVILRDGLLMSSTQRLLGEAKQFLEAEDNRDTPGDFAAEVALFSDVAKRFRKDADATLLKAERLCRDLSLSSGEIRHMMLGLDTIRVMGRVESGRLGVAGAGLSSAIDQLDTHHAAIAKLLQDLMDLASAIRTGISSCRRHFAD
jgi:aerotaxis receptor